jgi:hypothetical protein
LFWVNHETIFKFVVFLLEKIGKKDKIKGDFLCLIKNRSKRQESFSKQLLNKRRGFS